MLKNVWHETKGVEIVLHCTWRQKIQYLINTFFVFLCFLWNENNLFFVIWRRNTFPPTFTSKTCFLECKPYIRSFQQFCRPTPVKLHRRLLHLNYIFLSKKHNAVTIINSIFYNITCLYRLCSRLLLFLWKSIFVNMTRHVLIRYMSCRGAKYCKIYLTWF